MNEIARADLSGLDAATYDLLCCEEQIKSMTLAERIFKFEALVMDSTQVEIPAGQDLINGIYRRSILFPKNTAATGAVHDKDHMDVMISGKMLIATEDGFKVLEAPLFLTSKAGSKKAGIALEETLWASYYPTNTTTVEEAEAEIMNNPMNNHCKLPEVKECLHL